MGWNRQEIIFESRLKNEITQPIRVATIGTSLVQQNTYSSSSGAIGSNVRSWIDWTSFFANGGVETLDISDTTDYTGWGTRKFWGTNFGVSGQTCDEILARIPLLIRNKAMFDVVILDMGTNDMGTALTKEEIHSKRIQAVKMLTDEGLKVVLLTILARDISSWPSGSSQRKKANWINQKTRDYYRNKKNVIVHDWNQDWVDVTTGDGVPATAYSDDGIHFATRGGYRVGKGLWDRTLSKIMPVGISRISSPDDKFDAVDNPYGNITLNPFMTGTGGTASAPNTGTVPTSWVVERNTGSSCSAAASIISNGVHEGNSLRLTFTLGGSSDEVFYVRTAPADTTHTLADKWVQPYVTIKTNSSADTIKSIKLVLIDQQNTNNRSENFREIGTFYYPAESISQGQIVGRPIKLSSGSTTIRLRVEVHVNGAGATAPVIDISKLGVRQIDVPDFIKPTI